MLCFDFKLKLFFDTLNFVTMVNLPTTFYGLASQSQVLIVIFLIVMAFICLSCEDNPTCDDEIKHYIHLSHTRIFDTINQVVDPRIEQINLDPFDLVLLGGDICEETSKRYDILEYVDGVFNVSHPNTLWTIGNHDDTNLEYFQKITRRPHTYSYHKNGITFVVLNAIDPLDDWKIKTLTKVTDTISNSSHLILMTHHLIWLEKHEELIEHRGKNLYSWSSNFKATDRGYMKKILPHLRKVRKRGIQVIALAGDIGNNKTFFEERTEDGIYYLASGSNPERKDVKFLHFRHHIASQSLTWEFVNIEEFLANGQIIG